MSHREVLRTVLAADCPGFNMINVDGVAVDDGIDVFATDEAITHLATKQATD